jgi:hypothetical protein
MFTTFALASQAESVASIRTASLLSEWEQVRPDNSPSVTPGLCAAFDRFVAEVLSGPYDTSLDIADVRGVLRGATSLAIGRAEASGIYASGVYA